MRGVSLFLLIGLALAALPARAVDTDMLDARVHLSAETLQQPVAVKKIYREAWNIDNKTELTALDQLAYFNEHNPGFDEDTMVLINRGLALLRQSNFGTAGVDPAPSTATIREEPFLSVIALSKMADSNAKGVDILSAADTIEAAEHLKEKMFRGDDPGQKFLPIDIEKF